MAQHLFLTGKTEESIKSCIDQNFAGAIDYLDVNDVIPLFKETVERIQVRLAQLCYARSRAPLGLF